MSNSAETMDAQNPAADLRSRWETLDDIDRAEAIVSILEGGTSGRALAQALGCNESLIRHLKLLATAYPEEKRLVRQGRLSTRELVKTVRARGRVEVQKRQAAEQRNRVQAAEQGSKDILAWFARESVAPAYAEQAVDEARRLLAEGESTGRLPKGTPPAGTAKEEIIQRCRPRDPKGDEVSFVGWYAYWLAVWAFHVMPDDRVRDAALNQAWGDLARK